MTVLSKVVLNLFRVRVEGQINLARACAESDGRLLVTANHVSLLDGLLIALSSPVPLCFAVERNYSVSNQLTSFGLRFLSKLGYGQVVPLDSDCPYSIRSLAKKILEKQPIMIFPEGKIRTSAPQPIMPGVQWLKTKTNAHEFHIRIEGAEKSKLFAKNGNEYRPKINIIYGE